MKQAFNPYLPGWEYVPDGEPRVFGNRLYVYGSHDRFNGEDFCLNDYVCWSAPLDNLADWRYDGVIYRKEQDPRNKNGKMHMCAPDCVQGADGRYYLYYQLHELACTSVAVGDSPKGPFQFYDYVQHPDGTPWGEKRGDVFAFDPGVLADDDGKTYLYVGFGPTGAFKKLMQMRGNQLDYATCLELGPDMKTVKGEEHPVVPALDKAKGTGFEGHAFFEASSPRKIDGKYYLVYSSQLSHELCYATAVIPFGPFTYGGTIVSIGDVGYKGNTIPNNYTGNTHGGLVEANGQWYIFYHRQTNKQKCARQGCAEPVEILPDGSIPQVETTSCGLNGGPLNGEGTYEARIACNLTSREGTLPYLKTFEKDKKQIHPYFTQSGSDSEGDAETYIANLRDGASAGFKYFQISSAKTVSMTLRGRGNARVELFVYPKDSPDEKIPAASITAELTMGWQEYSADLTPLSGVYGLYFTFTGDSTADFQAFALS